MIKRLFVALFYFGVVGIGYSQVHTTGAGDVGIGTTTPESKLHVIGDTRIQRPQGGGTNYIQISNSSSWATIMADDPGTNQKSLVIGVAPSSSSGTDRHIYFQAGKSSGTMQTRMIIRGNGNVGIGNTSPSHKLFIAGNSKWTGNESSYTELSSNSNGQFLKQISNDGTSQSWLIRGYNLNGVQAEFNDGGINVNGTIKTKEVNVTATGWADYVFKTDYDLMPLSEVEKYIYERGHLPKVPSEKEILENGVNLLEMNIKLLEKVEELTMYIIYQEKRIKYLEEKSSY